jgi:exosortase A-associated hydrolase 1
MSAVELPIVFDCEGDRLIGVLSQPANPIDIGVVVVVGGPQYRAGSHRQFVHLARSLGAADIACLRFDHRGMGDSEGGPRPFDKIDSDIASAVRELMRRVPSVRKVVLWGLCDGASAALIALRSVPELAGVIALNPWVRSETSLDQAVFRRYYVQRIVSREFWAKVFRGQFELLRSANEFLGRLSTVLAGSRKPPEIYAQAFERPLSYQERMSEGVKQFDGPVLIVLSGKDLTAQEFALFSAANAGWRSAIAYNRQVTTENISEADHTFSSAALRTEVERISSSFVQSLRGRPTAR